MKATATIWLIGALAIAGAGEFDSQDSWWYQQSLIDDGMLGRFHLTAQQKTRYDELAKEFVEKREQWLNANREKLRALKQSRDAAKSAGDAAKADALQKEYREKLGELLAIRLDLIQKFRSELTPEQQKELDAALAKERKAHADTDNAKKPY